MSDFLHFSDLEVLQTVRMLSLEHLDIRTVTLGVHTGDCACCNVDEVAARIKDKVLAAARHLNSVADEIQEELGVPIINRRVAVTPVALVGASSRADSYVPIAVALDEAAAELGIDYIGGFSALVHKGMTVSDRVLIRSIPEALAITERICGSVNVASTRAGLNMDATLLMGHVIRDLAWRTADREGIGCAKLVVFCNAPEDNPFMAGAFHGTGEGEAVINVGISGPGVVRHALETAAPDADLGEVAELIKRTAFKITRVGELVGREASRRLGVPFGIVDLALAPTPQVGDSVAEILEVLGLESAGAPGSTAAVALLVDAVKKGGAMATSSVGGLSGAFIPVSEDAGMIAAVKRGSLGLEKLEAMTSVCSVGLDMVGIPGDTTPETIAAIIADEMAIGMINDKTVGVRILPVPGKRPGDTAELGGLLGTVPVMTVNPFDSSRFVRRGGRIPAPLRGMKN